MNKGVQLTKRDFNKIKKELERAENGLDEYAETLQDTWTCRGHIEKIYEILEKYEEGTK